MSFVVPDTVTAYTRSAAGRVRSDIQVSSENRNFQRLPHPDSSLSGAQFALLKEASKQLRKQNLQIKETLGLFDRIRGLFGYRKWVLVHIAREDSETAQAQKGKNQGGPYYAYVNVAPIEEIAQKILGEGFAFQGTVGFFDRLPVPGKNPLRETSKEFLQAQGNTHKIAAWLYEEISKREDQKALEEAARQQRIARLPNPVPGREALQQVAKTREEQEQAFEKLMGQFQYAFDTREYANKIRKERFKLPPLTQAQWTKEIARREEAYRKHMETVGTIPSETDCRLIREKRFGLFPWNLTE